MAREPARIAQFHRALVILAKDDKLGAEDLPGELNGGHKNGDDGVLPGALIPLEQLEELHVRRVLERTATVTEAAHVLGIDQATIYRKRKKMGLS